MRKFHQRVAGTWTEEIDFLDDLMQLFYPNMRFDSGRSVLWIEIKWSYFVSPDCENQDILELRFVDEVAIVAFIIKYQKRFILLAEFPDDVHRKRGLTAAGLSEDTTMPNPFMFVYAELRILLAGVHHLADWVRAFKLVFISGWR